MDDLQDTFQQDALPTFDRQLRQSCQEQGRQDRIGREVSEEDRYFVGWGDWGCIYFQLDLQKQEY